jgi:hypothetical protein
MPNIYRQAPDGHMMAFPQGTPPEEQDRQMQTYWDNRSTDTSGAQGTAVLPQGTQPSGLQPQEGAPDPHIIPLSPQAQMYKGLLMQQGGAGGTRQGVMAINDLLHTEPSVLAQDEASKAFGKQMAGLGAKQAAARRVYNGLNELEMKAQAWMTHNPSAFNAAIGPFNSNDTVQNWTGWLNSGAYDLHKAMDHDIHRLVAGYRDIPGGQGGQGSDAQDLNFKNAIGEAVQAKTPQMFFGILHSAKNMIRDKGGLASDWDVPHDPLDPTDVRAINHYSRINPISPSSPFAHPSYFDENGNLKSDAKGVHYTREASEGMKNAPQAATASPARSPSSGMPAVGEVRKGYRFLGGDPSQQNSWAKQ